MAGVLYIKEISKYKVKEKIQQSIGKRAKEMVRYTNKLHRNKSSSPLIIEEIQT